MLAVLAAPSSASALGLRPVPGKAACRASRSAPGCVRDRQMAPFGPPVFSPDGRFAYLAVGNEDVPPAEHVAHAVLVFARDRRSGVLRRVERVPGAADDIAMTADGRRLVTLGDDRLRVYDRDVRSGRLSAAACLGGDGAPCTRRHPDVEFSEVQVSPDGSNILLTGFESGPFQALMHMDAQGGLSADGRDLDALLSHELVTDGPQIHSARFTTDGHYLLATVNARLVVLDAQTLAVVDCVGPRRAGPCRGEGPLGDRHQDEPRALALGDDGVVALAGGLGQLYRRLGGLKVGADGRLGAVRCLAGVRSNVCPTRERRVIEPESVAPLRGAVAAASSLVVALFAHPPGSARLRPSTAHACVLTAARTGLLRNEHAPPAARHCPRMRGVELAWDLSVSPDGRHVYVVDDSAVTVLRVTR